jgi:hypothetical protein
MEEPMGFHLNRLCKVLLAAGSLSASAFAVTVKTVPWDPSNLSSPHTVITTQSALLTATVDLTGGTGPYTYSWNFGDATSSATSPINTGCVDATTTGCPLNLSVNHTYTAAAGTAYTAVLTVTDTGASTSYTGNYLVIVQPNNLSSRVNVSIDNGLWFLHTVEERGTTTNANGTVISWGGWDGSIQGCRNPGWACLGYSSNDATNVLAFESSGHLETGPASDPYTDDVFRGLAKAINLLVSSNTAPSGPKVINYNPALTAARCSDGTQPNYTAHTCATGTYIQYNAGATSCAAPPCTFVYDGNSNGQMLYDNDANPGYQTGMLVTALVGTGNPAGIARSGPNAAGSGGRPGVIGQTYLSIVQDIIDAIGYCQYYGDAEYAPGGNGASSDDGGGWEYGCAGTSSDASWYDDNSPSQWNAIGMIAANRGFGITIPPVVKDTNQVWVTWSQQFTAGGCAGTCPTADAGSGVGEFGYNQWGYEPWGPYAVTPSGMVQLAMDGVGRTAAGAPDQRWNMAETFYHDNFCDTGGATQAPKAYTYGLFSFTKAMEQHDPGGVLTPITFLSQQPSGAQPYDWYNMQASLGAPCDGVAQTLVSRANPSGVYANQGSYWYGNDFEDPQYRFETAWTIIMLQKTSFIACVTNLGGQGKAGTVRAKPMVSLSWTGIGTAASYNVQRASAPGGPFSTVGNTLVPAFNDQTAGLVNSTTYYYQLQPLNGAGGAICTSNEATIAIP